MTNYRSFRITGWIIVDEDGNIINRNPSKGDLKGLKKEPYTEKRRSKLAYAEEELLNELRRFHDENRRIPRWKDFDADHSKYTNPCTYQNRFGSWNNALKMAGLWEKRYNRIHSCDRCSKSFEKVNPLKENDMLDRKMGLSVMLSEI
jgi:hypothetical protein